MNGYIMKKRLLNIFLVLLCFTGVAQERLFQLRNLNNIEVALSKITSINVTERNYYAPGTGNLDLSVFGDLTGEYDLAPWMEIGAAGRIIGIKSIDGWRVEQRPMVYGNLNKYMGKIELEFNNRLEYKMSKDIDDYFRHKQSLIVEMPPFKFSWFKLFAAEEGFYCFNSEKFNRGRLSSGAIIKCNRNLEMKLYYMLERGKFNLQWANTDIVGFHLNADF
jgi:hypothetical protein